MRARFYGSCALPLRFLASRRASAAVEFAFVLPVLIFVVILGVQVVAYINAVRKVELIATSVSEMIAQATPPSAATTIASVNAADLHFSYDSALVLFPYLMKDGPRQNLSWWQDINIDYASIQFTQTSTSCSAAQDKSSCYTASVVWTSSGTTGTNNRACGIPQTAANDGATPSKTTLPRSIFGPGSIIAIDVAFTFQPTFGSSFVPKIRIARSVYATPRYASLIVYDLTSNDGIATKCT